jgi:hypothetical protein
MVQSTESASGLPPATLFSSREGSYSHMAVEDSVLNNHTFCDMIHDRDNGKLYGMLKTWNLILLCIPSWKASADMLHFDFFT